MAKHEVLENYISLRREVNLVLGNKLKDTEFGQKQMLILYYLSHGPITMRELADYTLSDPAAISRAVASLEKDGVLVRKASPDDQRKVIVTLTAKGRQKSKEAEKVRMAIGDMVDDTLTVRERAQITHLLQKVVKGLRSKSST